jgi:hypothetical protein
MTQILPVLGAGWPMPAAGPTVRGDVFPETLDLDRTQPLSVLRATWPGRPAAEPAVPQEDTAEPEAEQTMILPVPAERPSEPEPSEPELSEPELSEPELSEPELSEPELSEANHPDEGEPEQSTERSDEDRTTAGSELTEAMR